MFRGSVKSTGYPLHSPVSPSLPLPLCHRVPSHFNRTLLPLIPLMRTPRLPAVDWTDTPADLNGLVHFAKRRNLVSARATTFQTQYTASHMPSSSDSSDVWIKLTVHAPAIVSLYYIKHGLKKPNIFEDLLIQFQDNKVALLLSCLESFMYLPCYV
jgi:hypothetical protein